MVLARTSRVSGGIDRIDRASTMGQIGRVVASPVEFGELKKLTTKMASSSAGNASMMFMTLSVTRSIAPRL